MSKHIKSIFLGVVLLMAILLPVSVVLAEPLEQTPGPYLGLEYGAATGLSGQDVRFTTARIINAVLGVLGIVAVSFIVYAGFVWMTSGGNAEKTKQAQGIIMAATIGLVIILSAYAITKFVMTSIFKATTGDDYSQVIGDQP